MEVPQPTNCKAASPTPPRSPGSKVGEAALLQPPGAEEGREASHQLAPKEEKQPKEKPRPKRQGSPPRIQRPSAVGRGEKSNMKDNKKKTKKTPLAKKREREPAAKEPKS